MTRLGKEVVMNEKPFYSQQNKDECDRSVDRQVISIVSGREMAIGIHRRDIEDQITN